jgi:hypothetical protein
VVFKKQPRGARLFGLFCGIVVNVVEAAYVPLFAYGWGVGFALE